MVAEREQLGQPAVVRDHGVVIDLDGGRGVVAHLVVRPRIAVVRRARRLAKSVLREGAANARERHLDRQRRQHEAHHAAQDVGAGGSHDALDRVRREHHPVS